jgi:hypothetical protein
VESEDSQRAQKIIREMANPTEIIINLLYLIRHKYRDPQAILQYLDMADSQARRLMEIAQRESSFRKELLSDPIIRNGKT